MRIRTAKLPQKIDLFSGDGVVEFQKLGVQETFVNRVLALTFTQLRQFPRPNTFTLVIFPKNVDCPIVVDGAHESGRGRGESENETRVHRPIFSYSSAHSRRECSDVVTGCE
jgi:hypothetical protein